MTQLSQEIHDHEWLDYDDKFSCFASEKVRDGCYPRIMDMPNQQKKQLSSFTASPTHPIS